MSKYFAWSELGLIAPNKYSSSPSKMHFHGCSARAHDTHGHTGSISVEYGKYHAWLNFNCIMVMFCQKSIRCNSTWQLLTRIRCSDMFQVLIIFPCFIKPSLNMQSCSSFIHSYIMKINLNKSYSCNSKIRISKHTFMQYLKSINIKRA